ITATATGFANAKGVGLQFGPFGHRQSFVEAYAQLSKRSLPQRLPLAQRTVIESQIELPPGWTATMPEGAREAGPQGAYEIAYTREAAKIVPRQTLTLNGGVLHPPDYAALRPVLGRLADALQRPA